MALKKVKPLQVMAVLQKGTKQRFVEMHNITIHAAIELPAVHLARRHKINLEGLKRKLFKVDRMRSAAFCEQHQVVKRMPVRAVQVLVVHFQVRTEPADDQLVMCTE